MIGNTVKHYNTQEDFEQDLLQGKAWLAGRYYLHDVKKIYDHGAYFDVKQDLSNYATTDEIPENVSDLNNDTGYITNVALDTYATQTYAANQASGALSQAREYADQKVAAITIPSKVSMLENDSNYATQTFVSNAIGQIVHPTKLSQFNNDTGFITLDAVPTKVSQLANDSNFITVADAHKYSDDAILNLINSAPGSMDTLKELSDAILDNKDVIEALDGAITNKADKSELRYGTYKTTTVAGIPTTNQVVLATVSASGTLTLANGLADGTALHIIINNSGSAEITITLNISNAKYLDGITTLKIAAGEYGEVSVIGIDGSGHFVRSVF